MARPLDELKDMTLRDLIMKLNLSDDEFDDPRKSLFSKFFSDFNVHCVPPGYIAPKIFLNFFKNDFSRGDFMRKIDCAHLRSLKCFLDPDSGK